MGTDLFHSSRRGRPPDVFGALEEEGLLLAQLLLLFASARERAHNHHAPRELLLVDMHLALRSEATLAQHLFKDAGREPEDGALWRLLDPLGELLRIDAIIVRDAAVLEHATKATRWQRSENL